MDNQGMDNRGSAGKLSCIPLRTLVWSLGLLLAVTGAGAQQTATTPGTDLAFERAQHLRHGINASAWFAQWGDYSPQRLQTYTTTEDMALIARMGFDHVRLSVDPAPLVAWENAPSGNAFMEELDRAVRMILDNHLSVIIDIQPDDRFKAQLHSTGGVQDFTTLWRDLARHFASTDPEHVFFEIMNEPEESDPYRWQGIESTVAAAIRQAAPDHTILASGAHYSGLEDLLVLEPLPLSNIIYTFHDYEPFAFTHQGATWTSRDVKPLRAIPYPSSPQDVAPELSQEPSLEAQYFLDRYGLDRWDAARVENTIEFAHRWSEMHHAPVYCGEFGVLRSFAPPAMRAQWIHDMRVSLEKNDIGWAMWDYQGSFAVVTKADGRTTPDRQILDALGLHPALP